MSYIKQRGRKKPSKQKEEWCSQPTKWMCFAESVKVDGKSIEEYITQSGIGRKKKRCPRCNRRLLSMLKESVCEAAWYFPPPHKAK